MSYELFASRDPRDPKFEAHGLLLTGKPYWSRVYLVGKGEHEGTTLMLTREQIHVRNFGNDRELAEWLDLMFLRAHAQRSIAKK